MMKLTAETDKRRQVESQLHASEVDKEKLKLERVRLQIKMDELKMKFQQGRFGTRLPGYQVKWPV